MIASFLLTAMGVVTVLILATFATVALFAGDPTSPRGTIACSTASTGAGTEFGCQGETR